MKVLIGLGNPPREYAGTRHNVGAEVIDILARRMGCEMWRNRFHSLAHRGRVGDEEVLLLKPMTFMNRSGLAARAACRDLELEPTDIVAVVDDVNLELGRLRLRRRGSSGGHLGLESIARMLGTVDFPRLRIGVGCPAIRSVLKDHVLSEFDDEERQIINPRLQEAADALEDLLLNGIEHAMNEFNP